MVKIVRTQTKGMVTIPVEYREKLGIDSNTLLEAKLVDNGVLFMRINIKPSETDLYSDAQIAEWVKEDKMDKQTADKLKKLLK